MYIRRSPYFNPSQCQREQTPPSSYDTLLVTTERPPTTSSERPPDSASWESRGSGSEMVVVHPSAIYETEEEGSNVARESLDNPEGKMLTLAEVEYVKRFNV